MNEEGAPFDSGFDDAGPFSVTPEADGVPLDAALREFGPAAFEDLMPRLRALAADLDAAHLTGFIHGRLHPSKVFVTADGTYLLGARVPRSLDRRWPIQPPYTAPEVMAGDRPSPMADQFSLAAIAYEWMFGRPISGPAERTIDVRTIPNVERGALAKAYSRALAPEPFRRFGSCADFCDAIAASREPSLPLMAADQDEEDLVGPFQPDEPPQPMVVPMAPVAEEPDFDSMAPLAERSASAMATETHAIATADRQRFSGLALILATIVGAVFGFAAGYMARPRALQQAVITDGRSTGSAGSTGSTGSGSTGSRKPVEPAERVERAEPRKAPVETQRIGRLLVRSTPPGASVTVDGVSRGVTPLALRDLDLGARDITVSRQGYEAEERRIVLTRARPSRSVEVRLSQQDLPKRAESGAREGGPRPSTPGSLGKPAVATGALAVESRPTGAAVAVNGKPSGTTPLTINDLPPGDYRVTMTLEGHQPFATTVRVVAGERARAAARLTEQEQE